MRVQNLALALPLGMAAAQRPANESICDYYTTALLKNNTAANQYTLLTLVVNTAVIGNYTKPNVGIKVPGILAPGSVNGTSVNLLGYFDGMFESSNRGGSSGVSVNFLDDGGATPLMNNMPANGTSSNQYKLLTHLYQYFGYLLGCSQYGMGAFPAYQGFGSMAEVHKFMDLDYAEVSYFIEQVGMSAASFGVATEDVTAVGMSLMNLFGYRCAPATTVIPAQGPELESICVAADCPLAANATCSAYSGYSNLTMPATNSTVVAAMSSMGSSSGAMSTSGSSSGASSTSSSTPAQQTTNAGALQSASMALLAVAGLAAACVM